MGKYLIIAGVVLIMAGLLISLLPDNGLPRLPGDIRIERENYSFYFPLGWCVLVSMVLSLVFWFINR